MAPDASTSRPARTASSAGQLIMLEKGSYTLLLQVTASTPVGQVITFAADDSLKLNVHTAASGSAAGT